MSTATLDDLINGKFRTSNAHDSTDSSPSPSLLVDPKGPSKAIGAEDVSGFLDDMFQSMDTVARVGPNLDFTPREAIDMGVSTAIRNIPLIGESRVGDDLIKALNTNPHGTTTTEQFSNFGNNSIQSMATAMTTVSQGMSRAISMVGQMTGIDDRDVTETFAFQIMDIMSDIAKDEFPSNPKLQDDFLTAKIPQALGSMMAYIFAGGAARKLGGSAMMSIATMGGFGQGEQEYNRAIDDGFDIDEANRRFLLNIPLGAITESLPIDRIMGRFLHGDKFVKQLFRGALEESLAEGSQALGANIIAGRDPFESVIESAVLGAVAGGGAGGGFGAITRTREAIKTSAIHKKSKLFAQSMPDAMVDMILPPQASEDVDVQPASNSDIQPIVNMGEIRQVVDGLSEEESSAMAATLMEELSDPSFESKVEAEVFVRANATLAALVNLETEAKDAARFQSRIADAQAKADDSRTPQLDEKVTATMKRLGILPSKGSKTVTEKEALVQKLRGEQKAASKASKETALVVARKARFVLKEKVKELRADYNQRIRDARSTATDKERARNNVQRSLQDQLTRLVQDSISDKALRSEMISTINKVGRGISMGNALRKMDTLIAKHEHQLAIDDLESTAAKARKRQFHETYRQPIADILDAIDFKPRSKKLVKQFEDTKKWMSENPDADMPQVVVDELGRLGQVPFDQLDQSEAEAATNAVKAIIKLDSLKQKIIHRGKVRDKQETIAGMIDEMNAESNPLSMPERGPGKKTKRIPKNQKTALGGVVSISTDVTLHLLPESLASAISGGRFTKTTQTLYDNVRDGQTRAWEGEGQDQQVMNGIIKSAGFELGSKRLAKISTAFAGHHTMASKALAVLKDEPEVDVGETKAETHRIVFSDASEINITSGERMHLLASFMDRSTLELITQQGAKIAFQGTEIGKEIGLTVDDIHQIKLSAPKWEHKMVDKFIRHINGPMRNLVRDWSIKNLNFDITTDETYFHRDRRLEEDQKEDFKIIDAVRLYDKAVESTSIVHQRVGGSVPIKIGDIFASFTRHSHETNAIAHIAPAIKQAHSVLNSNEIRARLLNSDRGEDVFHRFNSVYDVMAQDVVGSGSVDAITGRLQKTISNMSKLIALNPQVASYQPISILAAATEIDEVYLLSSLSALADFSLNDSINSESARLAYRGKSNGGGIASEGFNGVPGIAGFKAKDEWMFQLIKWSDQGAVRVIWKAAHAQAEATAKEGETTEETKARAVDLAERTIDRTQPTFDSLHLSGLAIAAKQNTLIRPLNVFRSQRAKNYDIAIRAALEAGDNPRDSIRKIAHTIVLQSLGVSMIKWMWRTAFVGGLIAITGGRVDDDKEDEFAAAIIKGATEASFGNVPFGSSVAFLFNQAFKARWPEQFKGSLFTPSISPMSSLAESTWEAGGDISRYLFTEDGESEDLWKGLLSLTTSGGALFAGIPPFPVRIIEKVYKGRLNQEKRRQKRRKKHKRVR